MKLYPLVFTFRDLIAGHGYLAIVSMDGRVLLTEEDDGDTWMYGVQPGGIAGGDVKRDVAFDEFKKSYLSVLYDIAADAGSFEEFDQKVTAFFEAMNEPNARDWDTALKEVREKNIGLDDLKKVNADSRKPCVRVELVAAPEESKPNVNTFGHYAEAA